MQAAGTVLVLIWMAMVVIAILTLIRGRVNWLRLRSRKAGWWLLAASLPVIFVAGLLLPKPPASTTASPAASSTPPATSAARTPPKPPAPVSTSAAPSSVAPTTVPNAPTAVAKSLSCSDIGGVFVAHGTDGRGDCEPSDSRAKCHVPPGEQDPNYVAEFELNPPFPGGAVDRSEVTMAEMPGMTASNLDCWKLPPVN